MAYNSTTWSPDTLSKASETSSATLNNATLSGTLTVTGATQLNNDVTVGINDGDSATSHVVRFQADNISKFLLWNPSLNSGSGRLRVMDNGQYCMGSSDDFLLYHDGSNSYITNATGALKLATETSGIAVTIGHTTSEVTIGDNLTVTGTLTLGSGAELTEAELEMLDGITAGTVIASKAIVTDSNIDITGGRNITISGELDAGSLDISGNADIDGVLVAKTYKPETIFAYNLAATSALSSGTEYYMSVGGNPLDHTTLVLGVDPTSNLIQTALCDFTIERLAVNIYTSQPNVTSVEIRLKKYDGSGDIDDKDQWGTVGTVATIHNSSTLNADTRVVQTPTDWVIEKNEIWGLTLEYTISDGTITNVQIGGNILMLQDWSDIIANT
jgi:hypothetical protein